jgi:hypothetical protein
MNTAFDGLIVSDNNDIRWVQDKFHVTSSRDETISKALSRRRNYRIGLAAALG